MLPEEEISEEREARRREIVVPGELLAAKGLKPGFGTYKVGTNIYASILGLKNIRATYVNIIPLSGRYIPKPGDALIGKIIDISPNLWLVDINSPYPGVLHSAEVPWRIEFGDTAKFLNINDVILCDILSVDEIKRVRVSMKGVGSKKLTGGQLIEIAPSRVPRVIGKSASMLSLIKRYAKCKIFVGQNGRIWLDGAPENISAAILAIKKIEEEAHTSGLTERVQKLLEGKR